MSIAHQNNKCIFPYILSQKMYNIFQIVLYNLYVAKNPFQ